MQIIIDQGAQAVLRVVQQDEPSLFIASASVTIGLIILGFSFIRKRFDRSLSFLAWFAVVYGARLWMRSPTHQLMAPPSVLSSRLGWALNYFVPIPGFLFFGETGAGGRLGRVVINIVCFGALLIMAASVLGFPWVPLDHANSLLVAVGSSSLLLLTLRQAPASNYERVFRFGLVAFTALVVWTNVAHLFDRPATFEFYGFAILLCCLGYVAARRTLDRDQQLHSMQQELEIARRIQMSILPAGPPQSDDFSVAARYRAMTSVAGDFYEFLRAEDGSLGLLVADVSGHGVPAALIASMVKVAVQSQRHQQHDPAGLLAAVNQALCGNAQNQFVTAAYAWLDVTAGELRYAGAGHPPLLLLRKGRVIPVEENGLVMALMPSAAYTTKTVRLEPADRILLYTDGILEPTNAKEEEFGADRLTALLEETAATPPEQVADKILDAVTTWSPGQQDDQTLIVCDYDRTQRLSNNRAHD